MEQLRFEFMNYKLTQEENELVTDLRQLQMYYNENIANNPFWDKLDNYANRFQKYYVCKVNRFASNFDNAISENTLLYSLPDLSKLTDKEVLIWMHKYNPY